MGKYIEAETVFNELTNRYKTAKGEARKAYREALDIVTAVGEIEVVRCRGCVMWDGSFTLNGQKKCLNMTFCTDGDFYCGWGSKE